MACYDEFQQLILKLDHRVEQVILDIVCFKVGLNKDISTRIMLHKFDTIEDIFQVALEVERELKENSFVAAQPKIPKAVQKILQGMKVNLILLPILRGFNASSVKGGGTRLVSV